MLRGYFKKLGFGKKTGIELPNEVAGKLDFKYETEIFNAGFGQGITTTPIQNIQALTSLTNNGTMLKPYIVEKIVDSDTKEVVYEGKRQEVNKVASETTVNKMKDLMWETVNGQGNTGSGYRLDGYNLIGKTGTAQIADNTKGGYLQGASDVISSFAGIYPKDDSKVIIYASVKRPEGGNQKVIWQAIKSIVLNISKYYGTQPSEEQVETLSSFALPSYKNKNINQVKLDLENKKLNPIILGDGNKVIKQYPAKGEKVTTNDTVYLVTNATTQTIPDVTGLSSKQAEDVLKLLGVTVTLDGTGYVTGQSIEKGTIFTSDMNITLTLNPKF